MAQYDINKVLSDIFGNNESDWKSSETIPLITKEIEQLKVDLNTFLNTTDYDIPSIIEESEQLCKETKLIVQDMQTCKQEIEDETMTEILQSIEDRDQLTKDLQSVNFALGLVSNVVQCGRYVTEFDLGREVHSYTKAIEAVYDLVQYIQTPPEGSKELNDIYTNSKHIAEAFKELDIYTNTKQTAELIWEKLLDELYKELTDLINWSIKTTPRKKVISIALNMRDQIMVHDVLNALDRSKKLDKKVSDFAQFLKDVFADIIHQDCTISYENLEVITITLLNKPNYKPPYNTVLGHLRALFNFFDNKLNISFKRDTSIMQMIGKEIGAAFTDMLEKDCLMETIPHNINELQNYGVITTEIEGFQKFLIQVKFLDNNYSILHYVNNIDILFANKSCQYFLETARSIMLKDLSVTISVGVENIPEKVASPAKEDADPLDIFDKIFPQSLFYFPTCMISKTAHELLDLVNIMMEQAVQSSDIVCKKLYNTARLVFELYDAVVPYYHEKYLQTIPHYVALFHNNCMYLAHNLQTLGDKWLTLLKGRELGHPISFVDHVQKLRDLGYKHLTVHLQQQRKQILDNIRSSDLNSVGIKDALSENAEAAVRQCLRQGHLLKKVWIDVFPSNVFTRLMATLVNMFVEELIHRVCTVEDISMEMATQLIEIYTIVVQKAPNLFQSAEDIEKYVNSWIKLQELIFVLGGSLKDIDNHWNNGTGPLAVHFRNEELRSLIKALFQNTQMRACLLAKIK